MRISLKLFLLSQIYKQPLNYPNLIYIVNSIHKTRFKDLDFLLSSEDIIDKILKTIIFMNKIVNAIQIVKYLYFRLPKYIRKEKCPNHIIYTFTANLITISKTKFLINFHLGKTRIWICTNYIGMCINLLNICCII